MASKRLDLPMPLGPRIKVNGPKRTSRSRRFLNPETVKRVSIVFHHYTGKVWIPGPCHCFHRAARAFAHGRKPAKSRLQDELLPHEVDYWTRWSTSGSSPALGSAPNFARKFLTASPGPVISVRS